jgi:hypothetical protein
MKNFINKTTVFTSKLDGQTIRIALTLGTMIIFSIIAGAPATHGGG